MDTRDFVSFAIYGVLCVGKRGVELNQDTMNEIRKLVIISMFAEDDLMETFVLKGGTAIELGYKVDSRSSVDVDLSMSEDIPPTELETTKAKIKKSIESVFSLQGYEIFDYEFRERPKTIKDGFPPTWGGYTIEFKVIEAQYSHLIHTNIEHARRLATVVGQHQLKTFKIDISKYEYCKRKTPIDFEGYTIFIYTPEMIIIEKLRALCQNMKEYKYARLIKPRTRDLYDIYVVANTLETSVLHETDLIREVFSIKEVPLQLLGNIEKYRDFYLEGLPSLQDTVPGGVTKEKFEECFSFVVELANQIVGQIQQEDSSVIG